MPIGTRESIATNGCTIEQGQATLARMREIHMSQAISETHWSIARVTASVLLLVLALIYAGITALFVLLLSSSWGTSLRVGSDFAGSTTLGVGNELIVLNSEFAHSGAVVSLALCLLSGYAGLAALRGWRGGRLVAIAAGWTTIALGAYGLWIYASMLMIGLPFPPFSFGMQSHPLVSLVLCASGILVIWALRKAIDNGP